MEKGRAKEFFDQLEADPELRAKIKLGLETLAKIAAGYDVTEDELSKELQQRWNCAPGPKVPYSEPPGI